MSVVARARLAFNLKRAELRNAGIRLGAAANARGRRDPKRIEQLEKELEAAADAFVMARGALAAAELGAGAEPSETPPAGAA